MYSHVSHKSDYVQVRLKRSLWYFIFKSKYIIEQSRRTNSKPKVVNLYFVLYYFSNSSCKTNVNNNNNNIFYFQRTILEVKNCLI